MNKNNNKKQTKIKMNSLSYLWKMTKDHSVSIHIYMIKVPEEERKEGVPEKVFEEIMVKKSQI